MGNIVLIGFMGAGKTETARTLGRMLGYEVLDTDALVEHRAGASIEEIFATTGEDDFRAREAMEIHHAVECEDTVVACGGGALLQAENVEALSQARSTVVYLRTRQQTLIERLKDGEKRPLLQGKPDVIVPNMLAEREPAYIDAADLIIDTDGLTPDEVAREIAESLEQPE